MENKRWYLKKFKVDTVIDTILTSSIKMRQANTAAISQDDNFDLELTSLELELLNENVDVETLSIFSGVFGALKAACRTIRGLNCIIDETINIKTAAGQFKTDIEACGDTVTKQVQSVIDACNKIISTCNDIITLNVCSGQSSNGSDKTGFKCFIKTLRKVNHLAHQIHSALNLIKKIPNAGAGASDCVQDAATKLSTTFTNFPNAVKACAKPTGN